MKTCQVIMTPTISGYPLRLKAKIQKSTSEEFRYSSSDVNPIQVDLAGLPRQDFWTDI